MYFWLDPDVYPGKCHGSHHVRLIFQTVVDKIVWYMPIVCQREI